MLGGARYPDVALTEGDRELTTVRLPPYPDLRCPIGPTGDAAHSKAPHPASLKSRPHLDLLPCVHIALATRPWDPLRHQERAALPLFTGN
ncbi:MAG: hypothetical protein NVSMB16_13470 [Acidimicrobiales bacterium]